MKKTILATLVVALMGLFASGFARTSAASAATDRTAAPATVQSAQAPAAATHSLYGQCGRAVYNGLQLWNAWVRMGVQNSKAVHDIAKAAGWRSMDGSLRLFIIQHAVRVQLAAPAKIEDFGCHYGSMFSVGLRSYAAGEWVLAIRPAKFASSQVSGTHCTGCQRQVHKTSTVGRGNCANGFKKVVKTIWYVHVKKKPPVLPKIPTLPQPGPKVICTIGGVPQYVQPPNTIINDQGVCVVQTVTVTCPSGTTGTPPNCVVQTNQAAQACQGMNGTWTVNGNVSFCVVQQGNCTINVYINGNGNVVQQQTVNCTTPAPPAQPSPTPVTLTLSNLTSSQNAAGGIAPDGEGPIHVCTTAQDSKAGDTVKLPFAASYGSFSTPIVTITSSGADQVCSDYTAPNDSSDVGKTETWTVSASDTTAGVTATPVTWSFTFVAPPNNGQHP